MPPLVSVIIPSLNRGTTLRRCLESVVAQSYAHTETIVVDGGSTDGTAAVLAEMRGGIDRLLVEPDRGVYDAMNKGADMATGDFLYFLGADDALFHPEVLAEIFADPRARRAHMVYGNVMLRHAQRVLGGPFTIDRLQGENICHQAVFVRRSLFRRLGPFSEELGPWGDWDFTLTCFSAPFVRRLYVPAIVACFDENGYSSQPQDGTAFAEQRSERIAAYHRLWRVRLADRLFGYTGWLNPVGIARRLRRHADGARPGRKYDSAT